jgi:hypothetical protein
MWGVLMAWRSFFDPTPYRSKRAEKAPITRGLGQKKPGRPEFHLT